MAVETNSLPPNDDFANLLVRVRAGDESAAEELVSRYERAVLRAVRSRLGQQMRSALDSMDVVQSVHQSLLIGLRSQRFDMASPRELIALATVMVQRKIARHWRKLKRIPTAGTELAGNGPHASVSTISSSDPAPAEAVVAKDLLEQNLLQLDALDQQLVRLKLDGYSSVEAAAALNRDPAFVRMRWSRLRKLLRNRGFDSTGEEPTRCES